MSYLASRQVQQACPCHPSLNGTSPLNNKGRLGSSPLGETSLRMLQDPLKLFTNGSLVYINE